MVRGRYDGDARERARVALKLTRFALNAIILHLTVYIRTARRITLNEKTVTFSIGDLDVEVYKTRIHRGKKYALR